MGIGDISRDGERFLAVPPHRGPQLQQITIYGRDGNVVSKVGDPGLYQQPSFSPDGKKLLVMKADLEKSTQDIWTIDIATGKETRVTSDAPPKNNPMWSQDGKHILYVSLRGSYMGVYRKASDGTGDEEFLFRYTPGAGINVTDISPDGKYLALGSGGVVLVVALTGDPMTRKAIEFMRDEFNLGNGRFSPDGKFLAFLSNELDDQRNEVYVRPFDAATGTAGDGKWQLSKDGAAGMQTWRADGKEFFFRQAVPPGSEEFVLMSAEVSTTPTFHAEAPKALFKLPGPINGNLGNISRDGQRMVFAINVPAQ